MSDRDIVINQSIELEEILKNRLGAEGKGLGQQAMSVQHLLPWELSEKLKYIGGIRNKAAHELQFQLRDPERYIRECRQAKEMLNEVADTSPGSAGIPNAVNGKINSKNFSIPPHLMTFQRCLVPYIITTPHITFSCLNGKVVHINTNYKTREPQIFIQLADGREEIIPLDGRDRLPRPGNSLSILCGNRRSTQVPIALYIHERREYIYYSENNKALMSGLLNKIFNLKLHPIFLIPLLPFLLWLLLVFGVPILIILGFHWYSRKQFEAHILQIINSFEYSA